MLFCRNNARPSTKPGPAFCKKSRPITYQTPGGQVYRLYQSMAAQPHLLVAGATGSGKSVLINGLIYTILHDSPAVAEFILIDPKRVELVQYKNLPHVVTYATEPAEVVQALRQALFCIDQRNTEMQAQRLRQYNGPHLYIIIDELADLMTTSKNTIAPLLQRIAQIGRAARVHIIAATQCPLACVIPTPIKVNFDARVGLRTRSAQDSRNILDVKGCETLPRFGYGYYMTPEGMSLYQIPMIPDRDIEALCSYWESPACIVRR